MSDDLLAAIDRLTLPTNRRLWREDGTSDRVQVEALLTQLEDEIGQGGDTGERGGAFGSRLPIVVDIRDTLWDWRDSARGELLSCDITPHPDGGLREWLLQLSTANPQPPLRAPDLDRWTVQVDRWVRRAEDLLGLHDEERPRRLRDTPCPTCQASHVRVDEHQRVIPAGVNIRGDVFRAPALLLCFERGVLRSAECSACGATWFGQTGMWALGAALFEHGTAARHADAASCA